MRVELRERTVQLIIQRNRRRRSRVGISFDPTGDVRIDAPPRTSLAEIEEIVRSHERWIVRNIDKARVGDGIVASSLRGGDLVSVLGEQRLLAITERSYGQPSATLTPGQLTLELPEPDSPEQIVAALSSLWREQAGRLFTSLLAEYAGALPWLAGRVPSWRQRFMGSQWGSCSSTGRISLNSHLGKLPPELVRYVVLHELCHLVHLNHGRRYYALLDAHLPGWERQRTALDRWAMVLLEPSAAPLAGLRVSYKG